MTVHLVNLTNPMLMKGPIRELIPAGPLRVQLRLPEGITSRKVRLLSAGKTPQANRAGRYLTVTVPSVLDHEVIAVDV